MAEERTARGFGFTYDAEARVVRDLVKEAVVQRRGNGENTWTLVSDEPKVIGGDNTAPPPVAFLTASLSFCLLTHLVQYREMMRLDAGDPRVRVTATWYQSGAVRAGTIRGSCDGIAVHVEIESPEPVDRVRALLANAVRGCFVLQTLSSPTAVSVEAVLNGSALSPETDAG